MSLEFMSTLQWLVLGGMATAYLSPEQAQKGLVMPCCDAHETSRQHRNAATGSRDSLELAQVWEPMGMLCHLSLDRAKARVLCLFWWFLTVIGCCS